VRDFLHTKTAQAVFLPDALQSLSAIVAAAETNSPLASGLQGTLDIVGFIDIIAEAFDRQRVGTPLNETSIRTKNQQVERRLTALADGLSQITGRVFLLAFIEEGEGTGYRIMIAEEVEAGAREDRLRETSKISAARQAQLCDFFNLTRVTTLASLPAFLLDPFFGAVVVAGAAGVGEVLESLSGETYSDMASVRSALGTAFMRGAINARATLASLAS